MFDPTVFAFSASSGAEVPLEVCTAAEYVLTGEQGVVSWVTPAVAGPDGIRLDYVAMSVDGDMGELMRLRAGGEMVIGDRSIEAGIGAEGSKRLSVTHLHFMRPSDLVEVPTHFTLRVIDDVFSAQWESEVRLGTG